MSQDSNFYRTVVSAVEGVRENSRAESARWDRLTRAWSAEPPSHGEAHDLLLRLGACLSTLSQLPQPGRDPDLEERVIRLCVYFRSRASVSAGRVYLRIPKVLLSAWLPWQTS